MSETMMMKQLEEKRALNDNEEEGERTEKGETIKIFDGAEDHKDECEALDGGWGYVVLFGTFIIMNIYGLTKNCYGILFLGLPNEFGASSAVVAGVYNVASFVECLAQLLAGPLIEELGWRRVTMMGGLFISIGMGSSAFSPSASFLFFSFSLLTGVGTGFCIIVAYVILPHYFKRLRGRANAVMAAGLSTGGIMGPPVITFLQEEYGFKGALIITAALALHNCIAASVFHPIIWHNQALKVKARALKRNSECRGQVVEMEMEDCNDNDKIAKGVNRRKARNNYASEILQRKKTSPGNNEEDKLHVSESKLIISPVNNIEWVEKLTRNSQHKFNRRGRIKDMLHTLIQNIKLFRSPTTIILSISTSIHFSVNANFNMMVPFVMEAKGYSQLDMAWRMSVSSVCNLVTRLVVSSLSDLPGFRLHWMYLTGLATITAALIGFTFTDGLTSWAVMLGVFGVGWGMTGSLFTLLSIQSMGLKKYMAVLGILAVFNGFWYLTCGPLIGLIHDVSGSYTVTICTLASTTLIAIIVNLFLPAAIRYDKRMAEEEEKRGRTAEWKN